MVSLQQILYKVNIVSAKSLTDVEINDLQTDSRKVKPGTCFIAVKGIISDGHSFIGDAVTNGASAIICETLPGKVNNSLPYIVVENSAIAAGIMAHNFYGR